MSAVNGFEEAAKTAKIIHDAMPRGAQSVVTNLFNFVTAPAQSFIKGAGYMLSHGGEGQEARSGRELAETMFGADEGGMTNFWIGKPDKDGSMHLNGAKIAGGLSGLGIGYRALSGGGVYRDKDGNTDLAGIPFV